MLVLCGGGGSAAASRATCFARLFLSGRPFRAGLRIPNSYATAKFHAASTPLLNYAKLTPQEVDQVLRANEYTYEFPASSNSVKSYDSNQLSSNDPMEDTRLEATCMLTRGTLLGVFDGHAGSACAQVVAKRLGEYLASALLPRDVLSRCIESFEGGAPVRLLKTHNDKVQFVEELRELYDTSFLQFMHDQLDEYEDDDDRDVGEALRRAQVRLDSDLSREALPDSSGIYNRRSMSVAMSGAVSCLAHVDGPHLHVGYAGDCAAVLGSLDESNRWIANKLTREHNVHNEVEVKRLLSEHPSVESTTVIRMERLLGQLAPLRAFGDFRYKWSRDIIDQLVVKIYGPSAVPPNYRTPPYLTALPDIAYRRLSPHDQFLVVASDGLWDVATPEQVVRLVGEHMYGKVTLSPLKLPRRSMTLADIDELLHQRKERLTMKPKDRNAATHIIRNVLGGGEYGFDHTKLSQLLSLPSSVRRLFRDDITITVVYFDAEYLRHCPT